MICATCYWWRIPHDMDLEDGEVPPFGRCVAQPPRPRIFAIEDRDKWNESEMAVVWPQTLPNDVCAAHMNREAVDQRMKAMAMQTDDGGNPTVN